MDDEEVEIVDAPVCELLLADGLDFVAVMEGIPEFANQEEIFALDETVFDCSGNSFTCFLLVAVICNNLALVVRNIGS
jgi:hypothetical protein